MYTKSELTKMTIKELKSLAEKNDIKHNKTAKKTEIIDLLLKSLKKQNTVVNKKSDVKKQDKATKNNYKGPKTELFKNNITLPYSYNKDKLVLLIVDPSKGHLYWDLSKDLIANHDLTNENLQKIIRLYDITNSSEPSNDNVVSEIKINNIAKNWYIDFQEPNRRYIAEYGYYKDNKFISLLRSNIVLVPRNEVSDNIDQEWMMTDENFKLIFEASGADNMFDHNGSQELIKFLASNIEENLSSGGASVTSGFGIKTKK